MNELRLEYDRRVTTSESLTNKSNVLMTASCILATLIIGFYGSLISFNLLTPGLHLILISVVLLIIAVGLCAYLNRVESQRTVFMGTKMVKDFKTDFKIVNSWVKPEKEIYYYIALIDEYVQCLKQAEDTNIITSRFVNWSIRVFLVGLISFPIFTVVGYFAPI